jgi:hypothetical protein
MNELGWAVMIGVGATAFIDLWAIVRRQLLAVPPPDYGLVGRWMAHMPRGRFRHESIAAAPPIAGERFIGWTAHYLIGVAYAAALLAIVGEAWIQRPTLAPALSVGVATVAAPFFLMQPGMGAGIAGARTQRPIATRMHSLTMHAMFGLGMYVAVWAARYLFLSL